MALKKIQFNVHASRMINRGTRHDRNDVFLSFPRSQVMDEV